MKRPTRSVSAALSVLWSLSGLLLAAQQPATIKIQTDKPLHSISPGFYGLMTEEINYSYDGGLYAEMVRNRTFQDHGFGGVAHWNLNNLGTARSTMDVDENEGPSAALPQSLRLDVTSADTQNMAAIRNEGYWGMSLTGETLYKGSLYAKAGEDTFGPAYRIPGKRRDGKDACHRKHPIYLRRMDEVRLHTKDRPDAAVH